MNKKENVMKLKAFEDAVKNPEVYIEQALDVIGQKSGMKLDVTKNDDDEFVLSVPTVSGHTYVIHRAKSANEMADVVFKVAVVTSIFVDNEYLEYEAKKPAKKTNKK